MRASWNTRVASPRSRRSELPAFAVQDRTQELLQAFDANGPFPGRLFERDRGKTVRTRSDLTCAQVVSQPAWAAAVRAGLLHVVKSGVPGKAAGEIVASNDRELAAVLAFRIALLVEWTVPDTGLRPFEVLVGQVVEELLDTGILRRSKKRDTQLNYLVTHVCFNTPIKRLPKVDTSALHEALVESSAVQAATTAVALTAVWLLVESDKLEPHGVPMSQISDILVALKLVSSREKAAYTWCRYVKGACEETIMRQVGGGATTSIKVVRANDRTRKVLERALELHSEMAK